MKKFIRNFLTDVWATISWAILLTIAMTGIFWLSSKLHLFESVSSIEPLIITFIGMLATFVVVSNFSQVSDIRKKSEEQVHMLQEQINRLSGLKESSALVNKVNENDSKIKSIIGDGRYKSLEDVATKVVQTVDQKHIEEKAKYFAEKQDAVNSIRMLELVNQLFNSPYKDILQKLLTNPESDFEVEYLVKEKSKKTTAKIVIKDDTLYFKPLRGKLKSVEVTKIDNVEYSVDGVLGLYMRNILDLYSVAYDNKSNKIHEKVEDDSIES